MSRSHQDQIIDDDESELCPLCIEEFDLSDKNFRPCPCGYQICQFCYNNIKTTMNGLCPACRRTYDDKNIQWKVLSPEEIQSHKETVAQQQKKKAAAKQKEAAKREADSLSRKHLSGIRVRQKNLVYVTGMRPASSNENLSDLLRLPEYFGQYGKIVKVVVSKAKDTTNPNAPVGVYVTFANKDDAGRCIAAVDGSQNYDMRLRAQYGTTKYCSAYLRGETCGNRNCMFLHEPGEESESFSRQDLSSMNVISTQSPAQANLPPSSQPPQPQPPPQQAPQSIAAATTTSEKNDSREDSASQADSADGSALPASSNWANRLPPSRRASQAPSTTSHGSDNQQQPPVEDQPQTQPTLLSADTHISDDPAQQTHQPVQRVKRNSSIEDILKRCFDQEWHSQFNWDAVRPQDRALIEAYPCQIDPQGGIKRLRARNQDSERSLREKDTQMVSQALAGMDLDEAAEGGSLQLGGEPEERYDSLNMNLRQQHSAIQPPGQGLVESPTMGLENPMSPANGTNSARGLNAQQQQHYLLQQLKSGSPSLVNQGQANNAQFGAAAGGSGHSRQTSRFSFANDSSASTSVKPVANAKMMSQQSSMMPPSHNGQYPQQTQAQQTSGQFFTSGVQGPPPGLKATGTPPVSGGGMFGQGHGFATAGLGYSPNNATRSNNPNDEMFRELLRNRGSSAGSGQASDAGRRAFDSVDSITYPRRATPVIPPGLDLPFSRRDVSVAGATHNSLLLPNLGQTSNQPETLDVGEPETGTDKAELTSMSTSHTTAAPPANDEDGSSEKFQGNVGNPDSDAKPEDDSNDASQILETIEPSNDKEKSESSVTRSPMRRQGPGKIELPPVAESLQKQATTTATTAADKRSSDAPTETPSGSSRPDTPSITSEGTLKRPNQPRTIRVLASSRVESPAPVSTVSTPSEIPPSVGKITKEDTKSNSAAVSVSATPVNEKAQDSMSVTTEATSRANTPPPPGGMVGSAPVKAKSKNQLKRERQERAKVQAEENVSTPSASVASPMDNVVQDPIVGRKKKSKKPSTGASASSMNVTAASTPAPSRPSSPGPVAKPKKPDVPQSLEEEKDAPQGKENDIKKTAPTLVDQAKEIKTNANESKKHADDVVLKTIRSLIVSGELPSDGGRFLRGPRSEFGKMEITMDDLQAQPPHHPLTSEELASLDAGEPVRRHGMLEKDGYVAPENVRPARRMLITPWSRVVLYCLNQEEEDRCLALEASLSKTKPPFTYSHRYADPKNGTVRRMVNTMLQEPYDLLLRPTTDYVASSGSEEEGSRFGSSDEEETLEELDQSGASQLPSYAEDALQYLDQFMLPQAPLGTANAIPSIGSAIPRTYTTGDPTYSVSGVDVSGSGMSTRKTFAHKQRSYYQNRLDAAWSKFNGEDRQFRKCSDLLYAQFQYLNRDMSSFNRWQSGWWREVKFAFSDCFDIRVYSNAPPPEVEGQPLSAETERQAADFIASIPSISDVPETLQTAFKDALLAAGTAAMGAAERTLFEMSAGSDPTVGQLGRGNSGASLGPMLSEGEAWKAVQDAQREHERAERHAQALMKRNKKLAGL